MAWKPDGSLLAFASTGGNVRFWNPEDVTMTDPIMFRAGSIQSMDWHPDGTRLLIVYNDGVVLDADLETNRSMTLRFARRVNQAWWNTSGDMLGVYFTSLDGNEIHVFDGQSHSELAWYPVWTSDGWSPDGLRVAEMGERGIQIWNVMDWDDEFLSGIFWLYPEPDSILRGDIRWRPDSGYIAYIDNSGPVTIWDVHTGRNVLTLNEQSSGLNVQLSGSWSDDGTMYVSHDGGTMKVWAIHIPEPQEESMPDRELLFTSAVRDEFYIYEFLWNGNGTKIVGIVQSLTADEKQEVWLWDLDSETTFVLGRFDWISDVVWRPHSEMLVADISNEGNSEILFWDTNDIQINANEDVQE